MNTPHRLRRLPPRRAQQGVALVVGLVLLLVLTVLAVANMSTSMLDLQMASNAQSSTNAFQAAERGVDIAMRTTLPNTTAAVVGVPDTAIPGTPDEYRYDIRFNADNGITEVPSGGFSLGEGVGFKAYHFDTTATGTSTRDAAATNTQSYYVVGPGGG